MKDPSLESLCFQGQSQHKDNYEKENFYTLNRDKNFMKKDKCSDLCALIDAKYSKYINRRDDNFANSRKFPYYQAIRIE